MRNLGLFLIIVILVAIAGVAYYVSKHELVSMPLPVPPGEQIFCPADAKLCPDGSYVARSGPKCEFAACPGVASSTVWQIYQQPNEGWQIDYPSSVLTPETLDNGGGVLFQGYPFYTGPSDPEPQVPVRIRVYQVATSSAQYQERIIGDVYFDASGEHPQSFSQFKEVVLGNHKFYYINSGIFEGVLSGNYYLVVPQGIYAFLFSSFGVDWTNSQFNPDTEPMHVVVKQMLQTFRFTK